MSINVIQSQPRGAVIFTSSQNWTVPLGVYHIKILVVSGGGGGGGGYSTTYTGGPGGSGAVQFTEAIVTPGMQLAITVGAGGGGGTGGASPASGGGGGSSSVFQSGAADSMAYAFPGGGGGAATSSANGANGPGGTQGQDAYNVIGGFGINGNSGANVGAQVKAPILPLGSVTATSNIVTLLYAHAGMGGPGGAVNSNGSPGDAGEVIIWWGD